MGAFYERAYVIDHNQAFDFHLAKSVFYNSHVFARSTDSLSGDFMRRAEYNARLTDTLSHLESIVTSIPLSWWYLDHECTVRIDFDIFEVKSLLECYKTENFWKRHE